jgi:hypothetical protein
MVTLIRMGREFGYEKLARAIEQALAEEAGQRNQLHLYYLKALLQAEMEDRERRAIELRMTTITCRS